MTSPLPEPWLRGPVPTIPALLQPAAHAFIMSREEVERALTDLSDEQLWQRPGGVASVGFHVAHLSGSTVRLLTYARGAALDDSQRAALSRERTIDDLRPARAELLVEWQDTVRAALLQLANTPESELSHKRLVGRAQLPSTVIGLLYHAAEHASRHTGQLLTTALMLRGLAASARNAG